MSNTLTSTLHASSSTEVARALFAMGQEKSALRAGRLAAARAAAEKAGSEVKSEAEAEHFVSRRRFDLNNTIQRYPRVAAHVIRATEFEIQLGEFERARALFSDGTVRLPHNTELWLAWARAEAAAPGAAPDAAAAVLEQASVLLPISHEIWRVRLTDALDREGPAAAAALAKSWLARGPRKAEAFWEILAAVRRAGAPTEDVREVWRTFGAQTTSANAYLSWARWERDPADAVAALEAGVAKARAAGDAGADALETLFSALISHHLAHGQVGDALACLANAPPGRAAVAARARVAAALPHQDGTDEDFSGAAILAQRVRAAGDAAGAVPTPRTRALFSRLAGELARYELSSAPGTAAAEQALRGATEAFLDAARGGVGAAAYADYAATCSAAAAGLADPGQFITEGALGTDVTVLGAACEGGWLAEDADDAAQKLPPAVDVGGVGLKVLADAFSKLTDNRLQAGLDDVGDVLADAADGAARLLTVSGADVGAGALVRLGETHGGLTRTFANAEAAATLTLFALRTAERVAAGAAAGLTAWLPTAERALATARACAGAWLRIDTSAEALSAVQRLVALDGSAGTETLEALAHAAVRAVASGRASDADAACNFVEGALPQLSKPAEVTAPLLGVGVRPALLHAAALAGRGPRAAARMRALVADYDSLLAQRVRELATDDSASPAQAAQAAVARSERAELALAVRAAGPALKGIADTYVEHDYMREFGGVELSWPRFGDIDGVAPAAGPGARRPGLAAAMERWRAKKNK